MHKKQTKIPSGRATVPVNTPLRPLQPYTRCPCGSCPECRSNAKWDRIFAKFETRDYDEIRGIFQSPLNDL
jgi:hypothetical protein